MIRSHTAYISAFASAGSSGARHVQCGLVERTQQDVRGRPHRLRGDDAVRDRLAQHRLDDPEAVFHPDCAPPIPTQHCGRIDQTDPLEGRRGAEVEEQAGADLHRFELVGRSRLDDSFSDLHDHLGLDFLVDRREQLHFVSELVIERAPGHPRRFDDRLRGNVREPVLREQLSSRGEQGRASGRSALRLRPASPGLDFHTACT